MENSKKINVYIISGFLGSGKTTLLNYILKQFSLKKNVVIENEFGKINIDATLVNEKDESVYELTNGCICCSINNQLLETLARIVTLESKPDNLFVETTGIADAGEIASTFKSLFVAEEFNLKKIITVVDAENILFFKDHNSEIYKQIIPADIVVINKSIMVQSEIIRDIKSFINSINPHAHIILSKHGSIHLRNIYVKNNQSFFTSAVIYKSENIHKIKTILYETDDYFDIQKLKYELFKNLYLYYHQIYRIKGYVINQEKEAYLVQTTGKTVTITPANTKERILKSQLVVIGKELELTTIERILKPAIAKIDKLQLS